MPFLDNAKRTLSGPSAASSTRAPFRIKKILDRGRPINQKGEEREENHKGTWKREREEQIKSKSREGTALS